MGWSSLIEDNDKLREHWENICGSIRTLKGWAKESKNADPRHAEFRADDLSRRIKKLASDFEKMLEGMHNEAIRTLSDPNVKLFEHSRKKETQLANVREDLKATKDRVTQRDQAFERLQKRNVELERYCKKLESEVENLKTAISRLEAEKADTESWSKVATTVQRIKK